MSATANAAGKSLLEQWVSFGLAQHKPVAEPAGLKRLDGNFALFAVPEGQEGMLAATSVSFEGHGYCITLYYSFMDSHPDGEEASVCMYTDVDKDYTKVWIGNFDLCPCCPVFFAKMMRDVRAVHSLLPERKPLKYWPDPSVFPECSRLIEMMKADGTLAVATKADGTLDFS